MKLGATLVLAAALFSAAGCDRREEEPVREVRPEPARSGGSETGSQGRFEEGEQARAEPAPPTQPAADTTQAVATEVDPTLLDPASLNETAPAQYTVELTTTKGPIRIDVTRAWAPNGADRFYNLVKSGYFTDVAFFRVIGGFMAQTGIHGNPQVNAAWRNAKIEDDPVTQSNTRGMVTYATSGPNSRTTQFFINFGDNSNLDSMGFAPFGRVKPEDMATVDRIFAGYGESAPRGRGPIQAILQTRGNEYLRGQFPDLDYIESARVL